MNNQKSWIWILLLVISLTLSAIIGWNLGKGLERTVSAKSQTAVLERLGREIKKEATGPAWAGSGPLASASETADADRVRLLRQSFREMFAMKDVFSKEKLRSELLSRLAESPANLALAQSALTDPEKTRARFGTDQALARVYAIRLLKTAAEKGDESHLLSTLHELARELDQQVKDGKALEAGRARDLEDLLRAFVSLRDVERLTEEYAEQSMESAVARLAEECGFRSGYSSQIGKIFANELLYFLQHSYDLDTAGRLVEASTGIRYFAGKKQA